MPSSNTTPSSETLRFKPTADLKAILGRLPFGERSEYIRRAFASYMAACPVLRAIPLEEGLTSVEPKPIGFNPTPQIVDWLAQVPPAMRSYVIRHVIRTYARNHPPEDTLRPAGTRIQPRFDLAL